MNARDSFAVFVRFEEPFVLGVARRGVVQEDDG